MVASIADKKISAAVERQPARRVERRIGSRGIGRAGNAEFARKRCDNAVRSDLSNGVVARVGDEIISARIHDDGRWIAEQRIRAAAVRRAADLRLSGQRRDSVLRAQRTREREQSQDGGQFAHWPRRINRSF